MRRLATALAFALTVRNIELIVVVWKKIMNFAENNWSFM